jgi:hypothetical protein
MTLLEFFPQPVKLCHQVCQITAAEAAAGKLFCFVILSEAKNLSST